MDGDDEGNTQDRGGVGQYLIAALAMAAGIGEDPAFGGASLLGAIGNKLFQPGTGEDKIEYGPDGRFHVRQYAPQAQVNPQTQELLNDLNKGAGLTGTLLDDGIKLTAAYNKDAPFANSEGLRQTIVDVVDYAEGNNDWGQNFLKANPKLKEFRDAVKKAMQDYPNLNDYMDALHGGKLPDVAKFMNDPEAAAMISDGELRMRLDKEWGYVPEISGQFDDARRIVRGEMYDTYRFGESKANELFAKDKNGDTTAFFSDDDIKANPEFEQFKGMSAHDIVHWGQDQANADLSRFYVSAAPMIQGQDTPEMVTAYRDVVVDYVKKHPQNPATGQPWTQEEIQRGIINFRASVVGLIKHSEGSGWDIKYGGGTFDPLSGNPPYTGPNSAKGIGQFLDKTWRGLVQQFKFPNMAPQYQIKGIGALMQEDGGFSYVMQGDIHQLIPRIRGTWPSLAGGSQQTHGREADTNFFLGGGGLLPGMPMPAAPNTDVANNDTRPPQTQLAFNGSDLHGMIGAHPRNMFGMMIPPAPGTGGPSAFTGAMVEEIHRFDAAQLKRKPWATFGDSNCKQAVRLAITAGYQAAGQTVPPIIANSGFQPGDLQQLGWTAVDYRNGNTTLRQGDVINIVAVDNKGEVHRHWEMCDKDGANVQLAHVSSDWSQDARFIPGPGYREGVANGHIQITIMRPPASLTNTPTLPPVQEAAFRPITPGAPAPTTPSEGTYTIYAGDSMMVRTASQALATNNARLHQINLANGINDPRRDVTGQIIAISNTGFRVENENLPNGKTQMQAITNAADRLAGMATQGKPARLAIQIGTNDASIVVRRDGSIDPAYVARVAPVAAAINRAAAAGVQVVWIAPLTEPGRGDVNTVGTRNWQLQKLGEYYQSVSTTPLVGLNGQAYPRDPDNVHTGARESRQVALDSGLISPVSAPAPVPAPIAPPQPAAKPDPHPTEAAAQPAPAPDMKKADTGAAPKVGELAAGILKTAAAAHETLFKKAGEVHDKRLAAANTQHGGPRRRDNLNMAAHPAGNPPAAGTPPSTEIASADGLFRPRMPQQPRKRSSDDDANYG